MLRPCPRRGQTADAVSPAPAKVAPPESLAASPPARNQTPPIRVLVVDDHKVVREGLIRMLAGEADLEVAGQAADGEGAVTLAREVRPDVVTMDLNLPDMSGIEATRRIRAACPGTQVVGLSMFEEPAQVAAMRDSGAAAYVFKSGPPEALLAAIRRCRAWERAPGPAKAADAEDCPDARSA